MGSGLRVSRSALAALLAEAAKAHPLECCGLLLAGEVDGEACDIARIVPCANVSPTPTDSFEIDPVALIAAHKAERKGKGRLAGYYHSHPNGRAGPSDRDRARASGDGRVWAIIARGEVTWWRDGAGGLTELAD
ncbi:MAG: M67 family metallopeptidase [Sphingomonadales bacterium]|nr:M67 family metallopeptidase [Sphingomonadales bacterium]MDE2568231.1 M67 family metallopeptidase [Sphingomonadales bacterium]